ncbi:MAG: UDP-glucose 4-epimerase GalE [Chelatococcus sp.]|nr:MAG: UDP-glucose 4-epimerase GalE [Chelatococcus sp.]
MTARANKTVLVTGGAGYVGSHCCKEFHRNGWRVVCLDNLSRGRAEMVKWGPLVVADIADSAIVDATITEHRPDLIAHFAAYAYVGESVAAPDIYYDNNVSRTHSLLNSARSVLDKPIPVLFSSTCATYGHPVRPVIDERHPQWPINPYGWSKLIIERMLSDYAVAYGLPSIALRYFNAAGADPDGEIGELHDPETHAIPLAIEAALTGAQPFSVFGTDFETPDGSAIRDYIHVADLASAHVLAAERLLAGERRAEVYNLGTGHGTSVLEMIAAVRRATQREVPVSLAPRRAGDPALLIADAGLARSVLGWEPTQSSIDRIMTTAVKWRLRAER